MIIGFGLAGLQSSKCCSCGSFPFAFYKRRLVPFVSWKSYMTLLLSSFPISFPTSPSLLLVLIPFVVSCQATRLFFAKM